MKIILSVFLVIAIALAMSCNKDRLEDDKADIVTYLEENGYEAGEEIGKYQETDEGVYYVITKEGLDDDHPTSNSDVTVNYEGYLLDGTVFDQNDNLSFNLGGVIRGWQIGIPLIEKGGSAILLIPSDLAYGSNSPSSDIPSNSVLIFEVDLIDF